MCCTNTLIVFIDGSEIRAFGKLSISRYEGTKTKVPVFVTRNGKLKCVIVSNCDRVLSVIHGDGPLVE